MMDLDMGGVSDGTRVHQWEGAQASSQLWVVEPTNDGRVKIKSNLAGKLLDPGMATENGTVLQIWADVNGDNQFWTINEVTRKPKTSVKATTVRPRPLPRRPPPRSSRLLNLSSRRPSRLPSLPLRRLSRLRSPS